MHMTPRFMLLLNVYFSALWRHLGAISTMIAVIELFPGVGFVLYSQLFHRCKVMEATKTHN